MKIGFQLTSRHSFGLFDACFTIYRVFLRYYINNLFSRINSYLEHVFSQFLDVLLGYFITRLIFFLVFYGQFDMDFMIFTGIVGFSVSLNGCICQPEPAPAPITYCVRSLPQAQTA